jgi:hypothetical protein
MQWTGECKGLRRDGKERFSWRDGWIGAWKRCGGDPSFLRRALVMRVVRKEVVEKTRLQPRIKERKTEGKNKIYFSVLDRFAISL